MVNRKNIWEEHRTRYFMGLAIVMAFGAVLLFANLGDRSLWDDEAQTAVLARQIVKFGVPMFKEGENIPTDRADLSDFNRDRIFIWNTWLPYYIGAISFKFSGESELSARLPYALFGLLTFFLYYRLNLRLFGSGSRTALIAMALLVACVPFLLHMRQCRYYAIITFGTMWMVWAYISVLDRKKSGWIQLSAAGIICFYSFPIISLLNIAGIWLHAIWNERRNQVMRDLGLMSCAVVLFALPAVIYMRLWDHPAGSVHDLSRFLKSFWIYLLWINGFILPFALPVLTALILRVRGCLLLFCAYIAFLAGASAEAYYLQMFMTALMLFLMAGFIFSFSRGNTTREGDHETPRPGVYRLFAILLVLYVIALSIVAPYPFYRYLIPLVPLVLIFGAVLVESLMAKNRFSGMLVVSILLISNLLSAVPLKISELAFSSKDQIHAGYSVFPREIWRWTGTRADLFSFFYEITHSVPDPEKGVAAYLREQGTDGQTVKASYGDISLMFYLPKMKIISRLDKNGGVPDYIIERRAYRLAQSEAFLNTLRQVEYRAVEIPFADVVWSNNPDPLFHMYRIPGNMPHLRIYRRANA